jgi:hypothetical protein
LRSKNIETFLQGAPVIIAIPLWIGGSITQKAQEIKTQMLAATLTG